MEKTLITFLIVALCLLAIAIIVIIILSFKNKVSRVLYKTTISETSISENLKNKFDLIIRAINIIERELKIESKIFEDTKKIKSERINSIAFDNILNETLKKINEMGNDYKELSNTKNFNRIIKDIHDLDILITGGKNFYNKYAANYNNLIKSFPFNIFKRRTPKNLFLEGAANNLKIDF